MRHLLASIVIFSVATTARSADAPLFKLAPLFTDHMVLQQKSSVPLWGRGTPGTTIDVRASWRKSGRTVVNADSTWELRLGTPRAGGPFEIAIRHDDSTTSLKDVMIGEVWLCSGQSNMEMPLEGWPPDTVISGGMVIQNSSNEDLRLFTVRRAFSPTPESQCTGRWSVSSPATTPRFSATAYFFGQALQKELKVPVGLIHSSWGGTRVESWISSTYLGRVTGFDSTLRIISQSVEKMHALQAWLEKFPVIDVSLRDPASRWSGLKFGDDSCSATRYDDARWGTMRLPTNWERTSVGEFDGAVWFRKEITIPAAWVHKDIVLELGPIDDVDITYVNGRMVGAHEGEGFWKVNRVYPVPAGIIDTTHVLVAVRVIDYGGGGGIWGEQKSMFLHPAGSEEHVSIAGDWKFLPVADYRGEKFYVMGAEGEKYFGRPSVPVDFAGYSPTALYNGMISPLVPYALAGVIWYQGEANVDAPALYRTLFPLMMENWRASFRSAGLPFYYVQIAPFDYGAMTASQFLRNVQFNCLDVKNTGMAVTMDIGNPLNIHPANKEDVGRRLALWALAKTYGKHIEYSGPLYRDHKLFRNRIELTFDHARGGLVLTGGPQGNGFLIAGEDRVFHPAEVAVRGKTLIVSNPAVANPQAVRYAFTNTAQATLFNVEGLPSPSFRTDAWDH